MGVAPHRYVLRQRIARAKRMLIEGKRSIAEISNELGFFDQSHFCSVFRKITGTTPKNFVNDV
ncbi:MAG: helix-turn-helix transcriptional regulator [Candidatus Binataceae bacterium]